MPANIQGENGNALGSQDDSNHFPTHLSINSFIYPIKVY